MITILQYISIRINAKPTKAKEKQERKIKEKVDQKNAVTKLNEGGEACRAVGLHQPRCGSAAANGGGGV